MPEVFFLIYYSKIRNTFSYYWTYFFTDKRRKEKEHQEAIWDGNV
jgi:hypothetical protein